MNNLNYTLILAQLSSIRGHIERQENPDGYLLNTLGARIEYIKLKEAEVQVGLVPLKSQKPKKQSRGRSRKQHAVLPATLARE